MLVLHTHWQPPRTASDTGRILFWAETSIGFVPIWQRGRIAKNPKPKNHPFCAPFEDLRTILPGERDEGTVTLRLPTSRTGPLPSPGLIHDWELDQETPPFLTQWLVKGLWLSPAKALPLLVHLPELDIKNVQLALGADAVFWSRVTALALETLATHKLVPVIVPADGAGSVFHARWLPVLDGPKDDPRLTQLETAMPPVCRSAPNLTKQKSQKTGNPGDENNEHEVRSLHAPVQSLQLVDILSDSQGLKAPFPQYILSFNKFKRIRYT